MSLLSNKISSKLSSLLVPCAVDLTHSLGRQWVHGPSEFTAVQNIHGSKASREKEKHNVGVSERVMGEVGILQD